MIPELLKSILYGIVEGITEWLPISSTGHLILLKELVPLSVSESFWELFEVVIQLGAIAAVVVLFFRKLNPFDPGKKPEQKKETWQLWFRVVVAVLPSAVVGVLLDDWLDAHLYNYITVAITLIVYGVAFILVERRRVRPTITTTEQITYPTAFLVGCFQMLALIPGTSRSGTTILGAILLGLSRTTASEFSFFLAIPTMLGASALKAVKFLLEGLSMTPTETAILAVGCLVSFAVSLAVIRGLMNYVKKHTFSAFGVYRIVLGAIVLVYFALAG